MKWTKLTREDKPVTKTVLARWRAETTDRWRIDYMEPDDLNVMKGFWEYLEIHDEPEVNYERLPEALNPYELSDLLAGIRQLTHNLAQKVLRSEVELPKEERQKVSLLLENMYWKFKPIELPDMHSDAYKNKYANYGKA